MDESIENLPPQERIKALRALQEKKKKELEELEKKNQEEMEEAESAVKKSLEEVEEERDRAKQLQNLQDQLEEIEAAEDSLEETVSQEARFAQEVDISEGQYNVQGTQTPDRGYNPLESAIDDLNRLTYQETWTQNDQDLYNQRKEEIEQVNQYRTSLSDDLVDQIDAAKNILDSMGYKR